MIISLLTDHPIDFHFESIKEVAASEENEQYSTR